MRAGERQKRLRASSGGRDVAAPAPALFVLGARDAYDQEHRHQVQDSNWGALHKGAEEGRQTEEVEKETELTRRGRPHSPSSRRIASRTSRKPPPGLPPPNTLPGLSLPASAPILRPGESGTAPDEPWSST